MNLKLIYIFVNIKICATTMDVAIFKNLNANVTIKLYILE